MKQGNLSFIQQLTIYLIIAIGYLFIYYIPLDQLLFPKKQVNPSSKIEFVYQQF